MVSGLARGSTAAEGTVGGSGLSGSPASTTTLQTTPERWRRGQGGLSGRAAARLDAWGACPHQSKSMKVTAARGGGGSRLPAGEAGRHPLLQLLGVDGCDGHVRPARQVEGHQAQRAACKHTHMPPPGRSVGGGGDRATMPRVAPASPGAAPGGRAARSSAPAAAAFEPLLPGACVCRAPAAQDSLYTTRSTLSCPTCCMSCLYAAPFVPCSSCTPRDGVWQKGGGGAELGMLPGCRLWGRSGCRLPRCWLQLRSNMLAACKAHPWVTQQPRGPAPAHTCSCSTRASTGKVVSRSSSADATMPSSCSTASFASRLSSV